MSKMILIEEAKLTSVLEALEGIHTGNMTPMAEEAWNKAITALREALAEQPSTAQEPTKAMIDAAERIDWSDSDVRGNIVNMWQAMCAAAPQAQPAQQEPVAWGKPTDEMVQAATDEYDEWANENKGTTECIRAMLSKALKASPQAQPAQRTWVGLTHDEYDAICDKHSTMSDFDFLEDIEAKLKEKNT